MVAAEDIGAGADLVHQPPVHTGGPLQTRSAGALTPTQLLQLWPTKIATSHTATSQTLNRSSIRISRHRREPDRPCKTLPFRHAVLLPQLAAFTPHCLNVPAHGLNNIRVPACASRAEPGQSEEWVSAASAQGQAITNLHPACYTFP